MAEKKHILIASVFLNILLICGCFSLFVAAMVMPMFSLSRVKLDNLGTDIEFEGNGTIMPIDAYQDVLFYDLTIGKDFYSSEVGRVTLLHMAFTDGELSINLPHLPKPLFLTVANTGFPFNGFGQMAVSSTKTMSGFMYIKHEKTPSKSDQIFKFGMEYKSGKLVLIQKDGVKA